MAELTLTALALLKELRARTVERMPPHDLTEKEWNYIEACQPQLILNLVLVAVAAKEWELNGTPRSLANLKEAIERIWT